MDGSGGGRGGSGGVAPVWVWAGSAGPITFGSSADYTNNFVATLGSSITYNSAGQKLLFTTATIGDTAIIRYDTNPADGQAGPADFLGETVKAEFTPDAKVFNDTSAPGILTRIQANGKGVVAYAELVNPPFLRLAGL